MEWLSRKHIYFSVCLLMLSSVIDINAQSISEQLQDAKSAITQVADSILRADSLLTDSTIKKEPKGLRKILKNWGGASLGADIAGPAMVFLSDYGQFEGFLKINIKGTYYPVFEVGLGTCDLTDDNTDIHYNTKAPYFRVGLDYNFLQNKKQPNKLCIGLRYGFSTFSYDISGPGIKDPIFGGSKPYSITGIDCTSHWAEVVASVQVQIWRGFHMGWSARYKAEISSTDNRYCKPYYIPGYGTTTDSTCWGFTYNLIWDIRL